MRRIWPVVLGALLLVMANSAQAAQLGTGLSNLQQIITIFQENRSFDHDFGALRYAQGSSCHPAKASGASNDHACVDGLKCRLSAVGALDCLDWNHHAEGRRVYAFPVATGCITADLDHEWQGSHRDANDTHPERSLTDTRNDGFVMQNDIMAPDSHRSDPADGGLAMAFHTQADISFYYAVAERIAISDRYFSSLLGASDPNSAFHLAGRFFGHLTDEAVGPPSGGYRPLQGTIYDLLNAARVVWAGSSQDVPEGLACLKLGDPHFIRHADLLDRLKDAPDAKALPSVVPARAISRRNLATRNIPPMTFSAARRGCQNSSMTFASGRTVRIRWSSSRTTRAAVSMIT